MNKYKIYLYIVYVIVAAVFLLLASCAGDDIVANTEPAGDGTRMSLGVSVVQAGQMGGTRVQAPAIKSYRMKTDGDKPVYMQVSSEAYIDRYGLLSSMVKEDDKETRGVSVTSDTFFDSFGMYYYQYAKANSWAGIVSGNSTVPTGSNIAVRKSAGWHTDKYWPGMDYRLTFLAYAPFDADYRNDCGTKYIQLASSVRGYPTLTYTVPDKVEDQQDLLVSAAPSTQDMDGDYNKVVGMRFQHTLSAINFKIGSTMAPGKITKIEIKGVRNKGVYSFKTAEWTSQTGSASYSITPDYIIGDQRGVVFTGVDAVKNDLLLVMPQTVPSGAKIVVTIADGVNYGSSHEMELPIAGHVWSAGYTVTYSLSTAQEEGDYIFSVSRINNVSTEAASSVSYNVSSYMQSYYGSQIPVGWKAKYAVDDQIDQEEYMEDYGDAVVGSFYFDMPSPEKTTTNVTTNISALEPPVSDATRNAHTAALRARQEIGTKENPYDLSTLGDSRTRNTANCYVVGAPGWYKFPLVYGNCIKNGSYNTSVYSSSTVSSSSKYYYFKNHLNAQIKNPWLKSNSGVAPSEGILVWQDAYKMIDPDSVFMTSDQMYICFKVNKDNICQGNALLSARNSSKQILWSWHIWVTDENISSSTDIPVTNLQGSVYNFMKVPLGYCDTDRRVYKSRRFCFEFEQEGSHVSPAKVTFEQSSTKYEDIGMSVPYYEWGRPSPIKMQNGVSLKSKTFYCNAGYAMNSVSSATTIGNALQNPTVEYYNSGNGDWCTTVCITNLIDVNCTTNQQVLDKKTRKSVKSIYDPCPAGHKLPESAAYTAFTPNVTPGTWVTVANANVYGAYNNGFYFYTLPGKQGNTIFFPMLGWSLQNEFKDVGTGYLSASSTKSGSNSASSELYFEKNGIGCYSLPIRTCGVTIRPVSDD